MPDRRPSTRTWMSRSVPLSGRLTGVLALSATLAVGVLAAGCGSSKKSASTGTTAALTKAQFLAQGNAICQAGNQKQRAAQQALEKTFGNKVPTPAEIALYIRTTFVPLIQGQVDKLKALPAPAGEDAKLASMLALAQADLNKVKSKPQAFVSERHPFGDFARLAHAYGLTSCARNA
jgi:hypothetical protein